MFIVIMLRKGDIHIVNYRMSNGNYRTICSKTFSKKLKLNTLAADNTFDGICSTCKHHYDEMYLSDLNVATYMARNETQLKYNNILDFNRYNIEGPQIKYEDAVGRRWWPKLVKYQRLIQKR
jgi:hypothetical protein